MKNDRSMNKELIIYAILLILGSCAIQTSVLASPLSYQFNLPGGSAILFKDPLDSAGSLREKSWRTAVFKFSDGKAFSLIPRVGMSQSDGVEISTAIDYDISPSGKFIVLKRIEVGAILAGKGQPDSVLSRAYCPVIEIKTGCILSDQTESICGEGWTRDQPHQWGDAELTHIMLDRDRPSAGRLLKSFGVKRDARWAIDEASGIDNVLRCDPLSSSNIQTYARISAALRSNGAIKEAQMLEALQAKFSAENGNGSIATRSKNVPHPGRVIVPKALLYNEPYELGMHQGYLVKNDAVTILFRSKSGWAYVEYISRSGERITRWLQDEKLEIGY